MNQILSTNLNNNDSYSNYNRKSKETQQNNNHQIEIKKIIKFFAIALIIFGVFLIITGVLYIFKNNNETENKNINEPTVNIEYKSNSKLLVKVTHDKKFQDISYNWNEEKENKVKLPDGQYVEFTVDIPKGLNKLHILVTDENGQQSNVEHEYERKSDIIMESDNTKGTVKITYDSETEVETMTYKWDDEQPRQITVNTKNVKQELEAKKGIHKLTVEMLDVNGNKESNVQQVKGVSRPNIEVIVDDNNENIIVKATDETGLEKIEYTIVSDNSNKSEGELSGTEAEYKIPIKEGENKIKITVYNSNGVTAEKKVKCNR